MGTDSDTQAFGLKWSRDKDEQPFWVRDVETVLRSRTREMLERYAGVPAGDIVKHIEQIVSFDPSCLSRYEEPL